MSTPAIRPRRDDTILSGWESSPEQAPSVMRQDRPVVARFLALVGLFLLLIGGLAIWRNTALVSREWGFVLACFGIYAIVIHAFAEREVQFRRLYAGLALGLFALGAATRVLPLGGSVGGLFVPVGVSCLALAALLFLAVLRHEAEPEWRSLLLFFPGLGGLVMILAGILVGVAQPEFLTGQGAVLLLLGLLYAGVFIAAQDSTRSYQTALVLLGLGILGLLLTLVRSFGFESNFLVPAGIVLIGASLAYIIVALGTIVDWPFVVIARRELGAYFYSPVAYLVFVGLLGAAFFSFRVFLFILQRLGGGDRPVQEPIVLDYLIGVIPVFVQMFVVPIITMRLFAEERRTGSLEVMLTAPVNESSVVVGKFLAAWIFYLMLWLPWWLFLVALRYVGGSEFDFRPVLSFMLALSCSSAGLIAMGVFFSSLTSNQIIAAVFTFTGMVAHLAAFFVPKYTASVPGGGGGVNDLLAYVNFLDLWINALQGIVAPRYLIFHLSVAVFFLFATVKVLEARKWR